MLLCLKTIASRPVCTLLSSALGEFRVLGGQNRHPIPLLQLQTKRIFGKLELFGEFPPKKYVE
jgi:hypothetical protein